MALSLTALLLCFSMLVGTTFAWFTDSVASSSNLIKSGSLNIDLGIKTAADNDYVSVKSNPAKKAFDYDKWEPGYTEWVNAKVSTKGNLALKYTMKIVANGTVSELAEVIDVYYNPSQIAKPADRDLSSLVKLGTLKDAINSTIVINDELIPDISLYNGTAETDADYATLALHMRENAGNEYQDLSIGTDFSVMILATQLTHEEDAFNDQYDALAEYPAVFFTFAEPSVVIEAGESKQLVYSIKPENNPITWSSSDTSVATVSDTGVVTAVAGGNATITAVSGGITAQCEITVPVPVTGIVLSDTLFGIEVGATKTLSAEVVPSYAYDTTVTWESSNEQIATVDDSGVVTGVAQGYTTITATAGGITESATVYVGSVARIDGSDGATKAFYYTLYEATSHAASGDTVVVLADTTITENNPAVFSGVSMTYIDLNGHTISETHASYNAYLGLTDYATVIIKDSGTGGKIVGDRLTVLVNRGSRLVIESGTVQCTAVETYFANNAQAIKLADTANYEYSKLEMKGGSVLGWITLGGESIIRMTGGYIQNIDMGDSPFEKYNVHFVEMDGGKIQKIRYFSRHKQAHNVALYSGYIGNNVSSSDDSWMVASGSTATNNGDGYWKITKNN